MNHWITRPLAVALALGLLACGGRVEGTEPGDCDDAADNDGDGLFDCDDPSCEGSPLCQVADSGVRDSGISEMDAGGFDDAGFDAGFDATTGADGGDSGGPDAGADGGDGGDGADGGDPTDAGVPVDAASLDAGDAASDASVGLPDAGDAGPMLTGFEGIYDLDSTLDFASVVPDGVAAILTTFDELTDDTDASGATAGEFGQDPGAFLQDFQIRQLCHWQCLAPEDYSSCSEIGHPFGDIEQLYAQDLTSWSGAQARFTGGCARWETVGLAVQADLNRQVTAMVASFLASYVTLAADLERALTNPQIASVFTLSAGASGTETMLPFTHELTQMTVTLHDFTGTAHSVTFNLGAVGLTSLTATGTATASSSTLAVPEHRFAIDWARLASYIYTDQFLPLVGYTSSGQMLRALIDCAPIAALLFSAGPGSGGPLVSEATLRSFCEVGLATAATILDSFVAGDGALALSTSATGTAVDAMGRYGMLSGVWAGAFGDPGDALADENPITGSYSGTLRP